MTILIGAVFWYIYAERVFEETMDSKAEYLKNHEMTFKEADGEEGVSLLEDGNNEMDDENRGDMSESTHLLNNSKAAHDDATIDDRIESGST